MTEIELKLLRAQVLQCVDAVDADIIAEIRQRPAMRAQLLAELDVIDKVREKLNVRFERFDHRDN